MKKILIIHFVILFLFCQHSFAQCPSSFTDSRDGEVYTTIQIGTQCWMAENLRYDVPGNTNDIVNPANPTTIYGRLYDWTTVMNYASSSATNPSNVQGVCPSGWHLPSDAEWNEMEITLGLPSSDANNSSNRGTHASMLKSTTGWNSLGNGTNTVGFNALPAGSSFSTDFEYLGDYSNFWSSTEKDANSAWDRAFFHGDLGVYRGYYYKTNGNSCRCVKD